MRFGYLSIFASLLPIVLSQNTSNRPNCRCLIGQSCWPSEGEFSSLAAELSQPLIRPVPPASACYPVGNPSGNCTEVQSNWANGNWRADQAGAYQNINFETFTNRNGSISGCFLNTTLGLPCEQGSVPPIGVDARTTADVQATVRFVAQHNLRLVVKNTGHDYLGRSAARNGFMIWTHNMKNITYNATFIPEGGSSNETVPALTLGAGIQWREAYAAAAEQQRFIVGGISTGMSVGAAGGWLQGGGHSAFSPTYGLGVDNVVEMTIVTANGDLVVANTHRNSDLFWALRGGGAGTWGVVTSVTYRTYDIAPLTLSLLNVTFSDPRTAQTVVTEFIRMHPVLADAGWGGYSFFSNESLLAIFIAPNISAADANTTILPFYDSVRNSTGDANFQAFTIPFNSFNELMTSTFEGPLSAEQSGGNVELASRLLSREAAEERSEETARLLLTFDSVAFNFVAGGVVSRVDPDSVALHPGWREAVAHAYTVGSWEAGDSSEVVRQVRRRVAQDVRRLEPISPDSATYMNEASLYEPDFRRSFFGRHYARLRSIKRRYDPTSLFLVAEGVGSEDWNASLTCRV